MVNKDSVRMIFKHLATTFLYLKLQISFGYVAFSFSAFTTTFLVNKMRYVVYSMSCVN